MSGSVELVVVDDVVFILLFSSFRINSELIPIARHLARRQAVQLCRVCILTSQ